jgi:S1-C subfamily serine protease
MRVSVFAFLLSYAVVGIGAAFGQLAGGAPPQVSTTMDEPGTPLSKDTLGPEVALRLEQLRDIGDLPIAPLSRIARQPISETTSQTRSAADAQIYRTVSPSVVLIATKDGLGSGSLIGPFGEVLTNLHVVRGFAEVGVVFKPSVEGKVPGKDDILTGLVVKYDEIADLALVKVANAPVGASFLRLGDASDISVGLDVHAIGHPEGGRWTYTKGVISQYRVGFEWPGEHGTKHKADLIQTQTPINPGNSGGPLISESGKLIGVNTFKAEGEGLGFAVSVDDVKKFLKRDGSRPSESKPPSAQSRVPYTRKAECETKEVSRWRNKENNAGVVGYDMYYCTGKVDAVFVAPDDKSQPLMLKIDRNHDGRVDVIFFDFKWRDKWDLSWWDEDFSGQWTLVGYHDEGTGLPTRFESFEAYQKRLAKQ